MGGYGAYVWPAYTISAAVIAGLALAICRRRARLKARLELAEKPVAPKEASSQ